MLLKDFFFFYNFDIYILLSNILFISGLVNVSIAQNAIIWLLSIELIFLASIINFLIFSLYYYNVDGYIYSLAIIILAAAESAIGLILIIWYFSNKKNVNIDSYNFIKI